MEIKLRIHNFKNIDDIEFELKPITLFFGENGAGKSNILKAVQFLLKNIIPINTKETIYKIDDELDLIDFENIVNKNNPEGDIIFTINVKCELPVPDMKIYTDDLEALYHETIRLKPNLVNEMDCGIKLSLDEFKKLILEIRNNLNSYLFEGYISWIPFHDSGDVPKFGFANYFIKNCNNLMNYMKIDYSLSYKFSYDINNFNLKNIIVLDNNSSNKIDYIIDEYEDEIYDTQSVKKFILNYKNNEFRKFDNNEYFSFEGNEELKF